MSGNAGNTTPYSGYTNPEQAGLELQNRGQHGYGSEQDYYQDWQHASGARVGNAQQQLQAAMSKNTAAQQQLQGGISAAQRQSALMAQGQGGAAGRQAMYAGGDATTQGRIQSDLLRAQEVASAREMTMDAYGQQAQGEFSGDQYKLQKMLAEQQRSQEQREVINQADAAQVQRGIQAYSDSASAVGMSDARNKERVYKQGYQQARYDHVASQLDAEGARTHQRLGRGTNDDAYAIADEEYEQAKRRRQMMRSPLLRATEAPQAPPPRMDRGIDDYYSESDKRAMEHGRMFTRGRHYVGGEGRLSSAEGHLYNSAPAGTAVFPWGKALTHYDEP